MTKLSKIAVSFAGQPDGADEDDPKSYVKLTELSITGDAKALRALAKHIKRVAKHAAKSKREQDHYHWRAGAGVGSIHTPELVIMTGQSARDCYQDLLSHSAESAEEFKQKNLQFFED